MFSDSSRCSHLRSGMTQEVPAKEVFEERDPDFLFSDDVVAYYAAQVWNP